MSRSRAFYEGLGFRRVEGDDAEGWAVVVKGDARIGLYEAQYMEVGAFSLNFRGGNVGEIVSAIKALGHELTQERRIKDDGSGSATLKGPDGHVMFFETAPGETKKE